MTDSAKTRALALVAVLLGCVPAGDDSTTNAEGSDSESGMPGDGDGDADAGDGDGDTGDGDGDTGDGDGDGDGDTGDGDGDTGDGDGDTGDGDGDGDTGDGDPSEGCQDIVAAQMACGEDGNSARYCDMIVQQHPATADQAACTQAMLDRVTCYSQLECEQLLECDLWGCIGESEPCPEAAAAVEAACVRTACEQYFDQAKVCGTAGFPSMPGYCDYLKYLDALVAADPDACTAAYDEMVACFATLDCADFEKCNFSTQCEPGVDGCAAERSAYEQQCL